MKKTHKVLLLLLGVIVLAVVGFKATQPKEPEYQGRKLSEWIADLKEPPPKKIEAEAVVKEMKETALIFVEKRILKNQDPNGMLGFRRFLLGYGDVSGVGRRNSPVYQWGADFQALRVLGTNSMPVLERLLLLDESSQSAAELLAEFDAVDVLRRGTGRDQSFSVKFSTLYALQEVALRKEEAHDLLIILARDHDAIVASHAIRALGFLKKRPEQVVPLLAELMNSKNSSIAGSAIYALGDFGTNAVSVVPALEKIMASNNTFLKMAAQPALQQIKPKKTL